MEPKSGDSVAPGGGHRERAVPFRNDLGAIEVWYGTNTDIEDRKRAEALMAGENRLCWRRETRWMTAHRVAETRLIPSLRRKDTRQCSFGGSIDR